MTSTTRLQCACGEVQLEVQGTPIVSAECHCDSCRSSAAQLQMLPSAPAFLAPNGGTPYVLYRKDRAGFLRGTQHLEEFRLSPGAKTRRVVATCCNTPVFLEFESGHWLSLYSCLWPEEARPTPELRTMTSDLPAPASLPDDLPNCKRHSGSFFVKLLGAWISMGFRSPTITCVEGTLELPTTGSVAR